MSPNSNCFLPAGTIALMIIVSGSMTKAQETKADPATGSISGRVVDAKGNGIANAAVFVCDQKTGMPVGTKIRNVLTYKRLHGEEEQPLWVKTDSAGRFAFDELHAGTYRIFAQKWENDFEDPLKLNGIVVDLLGSADNLKIPANESREVILQPAGTGVIDFPGRSGNNDAFVFVSTEYPGDAVLGLLGWQAPFGNHVIGVNRMTLGKTTFRGLPQGKVGYTVVVLDNRVGLNSGRGKITEKNRDLTGKSAEEDMIAAWSNARYTPEEDLQPVFEHVKKLVEAGRIGEVWKAISQDTEADGKLELSEVNDFRNKENYSILYELGSLERKIELPDYGEVTVNEALASLMYLDLERRFTDRIARRKQRQQESQSQPDDVPNKKN